MTMKDYLAEIEHAASTVVLQAWAERSRLQELEAEIETLTLSTKIGYEQAEHIALNAEDPDDVMIAAGKQWDTYFGDDKERHKKRDDRLRLQEQIKAHAFSVAVLGGSLLQYAKQGISLIHGELAASPNGKAIGSQFLKDVIWQGRNQAMHWEEGRPSVRVRDCFGTLSKEFDPIFGEYDTRNLAFEVISLLKWTDFKSFKKDLLSLA